MLVLRKGRVETLITGDLLYGGGPNRDNAYIRATGNIYRDNCATGNIHRDNCATDNIHRDNYHNRDNCHNRDSLDIYNL